MVQNSSCTCWSQWGKIFFDRVVFFSSKILIFMRYLSNLFTYLYNDCLKLQKEYIFCEGGLNSEGIFTLFSSPKNLLNHYSQFFHSSIVPGSLHILVTSFLVFSSLQLRDFLYFVFHWQGKTSKMKLEINKVLHNLFLTLLPKQPKTKLPKWDENNIS